MNCIVCGKELIGNQHKYCSRSCQKLGGSRRRKGLPEGIRPKRSHLDWTDKDVQDRIDTKSSKIIYIGGYTNCENPIYLYCDDCGQPFRWNARGLRKQKPIQCDNCRKILVDIKEREHQSLLDCNRQKRQFESEQRQIQKEIERIEYLTRTCQRCGKEYFGTGKYCSKQCQRRQTDSNKEHYRRIKINNNYKDNISLELLAKRDKDICWICNKKVDWSDKVTTEHGTIKVGYNYPSIDHVVALANGGTHTWDNVRLAHWYCNSCKGKKMYSQNKNGQIILLC